MPSRNLTQEEINDKYEKGLIELMDRFQFFMDAQNEMTGSKHGFAVLIVRDPSEGNVDIAHNMPEDYLVHILKEAIKTTKTGSDKQTLNP